MDVKNRPRRVPFGMRSATKKEAVFLAVYVEKIAPYKYFKDQMRHVQCPALIMIDRWDGRMGFPGGTVEKGEALKDALMREIKEEIGITIRPEKVHPVVSHEGKLVTHLFGLRVLEAEFLHIYYHILNNFARSVLLHAYEEGDESHFMSEITGIKIVPLVEHGGKGLNLFLQNHFAGSGKEDLLVLLREVLKIASPKAVKT